MWMHAMQRLFQRFAGIIGLCWLVGCASPAQRFDEMAAELQFSTQTIDGKGFKHRIFANSVAEQYGYGQVLHVYLDGDGTPWQHNSPTDDPTSRNPMVLRMMARDPAPAILLGRPCYHGLNTAPSCDRRYWTSHRYSHDVVDSMAVALQHWLSSYHDARLMLIGFSGGGVLASLIAAQLPQVQTMVTIAANLDVRAWSEFHGYLPLPDSLNPIEQPKLPSRIRQLHLAGSDDDNVSPSIVKAFADKQDSARYVEYRQQHGCCWETIWPGPLNLLD